MKKTSILKQNNMKKHNLYPVENGGLGQKLCVIIIVSLRLMYKNMYTVHKKLNQFNSIAS